MTVFTETDCPADARIAHGLTHAKASNLSEVRIGDDSFRAPLAFLCWQRVTPPAVSRQGILCCDVSHREWRRRAQFGHTDYPQHPLCQVLVLVPDLPKPTGHSAPHRHRRPASSFPRPITPLALAKRTKLRGRGRRCLGLRLPWPVPRL